MTKKVQALYHFEAKPGTGELTLTTGDILTVTRTDVGEGWWEGTNTKGESGLFPEAYVEVITTINRINRLFLSLYLTATLPRYLILNRSYYRSMMQTMMDLHLWHHHPFHQIIAEINQAVQ